MHVIAHQHITSKRQVQAITLEANVTLQEISLTSFRKSSRSMPHLSKTITIKEVTLHQPSLVPTSPNKTSQILRQICRTRYHPRMAMKTITSSLSAELVTLNLRYLALAADSNPVATFSHLLIHRVNRLHSTDKVHHLKIKLHNRLKGTKSWSIIIHQHQVHKLSLKLEVQLARSVVLSKNITTMAIKEKIATKSTQR